MAQEIEGAGGLAKKFNTIAVDDGIAALSGVVVRQYQPTCFGILKDGSRNSGRRAAEMQQFGFNLRSCKIRSEDRDE